MAQRNPKTVYLANWAAEKREELVKLLGGKCEICGTRKNLEIDHKFGRDWDLRAKSRWQRQIIYRKEYEQNLLRLLCKTHNANADKVGYGKGVSSSINDAIRDIVLF